jgi:hypothetical protein
MEQFPMPAKNVGATLKQNWPDDTVKLHLKGKLSDIERNILGGTKYIAHNFDKLFDENQKLQVKNLCTHTLSLHSLCIAHEPALLRQETSLKKMLPASTFLD